jgi:thymidylate synthase ThyX
MRNKHITAEIIADSINSQGDRLTSFIVVIPRIVLAEFNTHRMLSRNSASSRAIPFDTMVEKVMTEPFIPIKWQEDHKGMQGNKYLQGRDVELADNTWLRARDNAVKEATMLSKNINVTKQFCNRLLEPFLYHTIIVTGSDWENFLALRAHEAAEIHIADLAHKMLKVYNESEPKKLEVGQWHIPFGSTIDRSFLSVAHGQVTGKTAGAWSMDLEGKLKIKVATARCARVSYLNYEGDDDYLKDFRLHDRLAKLGHWSPFEHCARAMSEDEYHFNVRGEVINFDLGITPESDNDEIFGWSGNFKGFVQYRKTFEGENKKDERVISKQ